MQILLAFLVGGALGVAAHFALPGRHRRGAVVAPALGAVVGGAVWAVMTWSGATTSDPWLWIVPFAAPLVLTPLALLALDGRRRRADESRTSRRAA